MNITLTVEQQAIAESARDFLNEHGTSARLRTAMESPDGWDREQWQAMAVEMGWLGVAAPERFGGSELGLIELALLHEETGRTLTAAPLFPTLGLALPAQAQEKLLAYVVLLYKWNRTYSLTALREQDKAVSHHLLDSLAVLLFVPEGRLLDVGSGGGMPGIPLAIARPELAVTLLDSNSKKTAFLQQAAIELSLPNITVHCGRVEQYHLVSGFAAITSRVAVCTSSRPMGEPGATSQTCLPHSCRK